LRVGVVGCGYWGPNLVRNLVETNRCDEISCFDPDAVAVAKLLRRFPSLIPAENLEELIDRCDAVMVATPVSTHHSIAKAVLQSGKAVFVEKPITDSSADARELVALAQQKRATLMVGHTFIYSSPVRKIKEYIDKGVIGEIYFLSASRVNLGIHRKDVNVVWDLAAHDLSILLYWLGEMPIRVAAVGRACVGKLVDVASIHCEFPSGAIANLEISWLSPGKLRRTVVIGSERMVVYDDTLLDEKIKLVDRGVSPRDPESFGEYQLTYRSGDIVCPHLNATEPLFVQTQHFLDCVEGGTQPETDGFMGLEVVHLIEAACQSLEDSGRFIETKPCRRVLKELGKRNPPLRSRKPVRRNEPIHLYQE
jgi:predicted dehydrogenase